MFCLFESIIASTTSYHGKLHVEYLPFTFKRSVSAVVKSYKEKDS